MLIDLIRNGHLCGLRGAGLDGMVRPEDFDDDARLLLEITCRILMNAVSGIGEVYRVGGEEIGVLMPGVDLDRAADIARHLCVLIASSRQEPGCLARLLVDHRTAQRLIPGRNAVAYHQSAVSGRRREDARGEDVPCQRGL